MAEDGNSRGICDSCKHARDCALAPQSGLKVFHCEEFEIDESEPVRSSEAAAIARSTFQPQSLEAAGNGLPEHRGLCSDCASRLCCALAEAEGGVWHCEEYDWMPRTEVGQDPVPARASEADASVGIRPILEQHGNGARGALIAILEDIQAEYGYLPEPALRAVSDELGLSLVDIYGVATFYRSFTLTPRGKHLVCVCQGTACHVRGAPLIVEELERQLGIARGETTPDGEFTLETANCLGACALGPIVVVDGQYFSNVGTAKARLIVRKARRAIASGEQSAQVVAGK
jgi:NADH-quinone oxidoreductase subunit E